MNDPQVVFFTICLDAMPFITWHLPVFNQLGFKWQWIIAEGTAKNIHCTKWCRPLHPRLSIDGTSEYLNQISYHPNIRLIRKQSWNGKIEMVNACVSRIKNPCIVIEVDADELWAPETLEKLVYILHQHEDKRVAAQFYCRYFVGQNIITLGENCYGNNPGEWSRAWTWKPGDVFVRHEPPIRGPFSEEKVLGRDYMKSEGITFEHYAYAFPQQLRFKEHYYGYRDAHAHWLRLQKNRQWPVKLKDFLPWVDDRVMATALHTT